ncbi:DUF1810 domain-containing protein [Cardiobacteriaceae bacterium TAE3-ERU3]|nr:DUF1810 domain-containing protein [Cardiobacteriaceae bacterium TAE3-ERU3]
MSDLSRFHTAQQRHYPTALAEIRAGRKQSHWMWFIFPQIAGLGQSATSREYAIRDLDEARAYLDDETLVTRLREISAAVLQHRDESATVIFGSIDAQKLHACMTLFQLAGEETICQQVLDAFFEGKSHQQTIELLNKLAR